VDHVLVRPRYREVEVFLFSLHTLKHIGGLALSLDESTLWLREDWLD
jgi:hypothetical protein